MPKKSVQNLLLRTSLKIKNNDNVNLNNYFERQTIEMRATLVSPLDAAVKLIRVYVTLLVRDGATSRPIVSARGRLFLSAASREPSDLRLYSLEPIYPILGSVHTDLQKCSPSATGGLHSFTETHELLTSRLRFFTCNTRGDRMKMTISRYGW
jgi:hypothetical protein